MVADQTTDRVRITAADFNGRTWDGNPFSPPAPHWLCLAVLAGEVTPHTRGSTDYARWDVKTPDGVVDAGPGDWIVQGKDDGRPLRVEVCRG